MAQVQQPGFRCVKTQTLRPTFLGQCQVTHFLSHLHPTCTDDFKTHGSCSSFFSFRISYLWFGTILFKLSFILNGITCSLMLSSLTIRRFCSWTATAILLYVCNLQFALVYAIGLSYAGEWPLPLSFLFVSSDYSCHSVCYVLQSWCCMLLFGSWLPRAYLFRRIRIGGHSQDEASCHWR